MFKLKKFPKNFFSILLIAVLAIFLFGIATPDSPLMVSDCKAQEGSLFNISFKNPIGETGDITTFFEHVIAGLLGIIAFLSVLFIVIAGVVYIIASSSGNENMVSVAKKMWMVSLLGLAIALAGPTFLQEIKEIVLSGGPMPQNLDEAPTLTQIVENTLSFLLTILGVLAVIGLVISSVFYLAAGGNQQMAEKAKSSVKYSLLGVLVAVASLVLVKEIIKLITG